MRLNLASLWIDKNQGVTNTHTGDARRNRAYGYIGTKAEYTDEDGDRQGYCGWFFTWPGLEPGQVTEAEVESMVESLELDEAELHRRTIPRHLAERMLRTKLEPTKTVI